MSNPRILIDYNFWQSARRKERRCRRDPASLTKMMTSYVIGQAMKAGKFKESDLVTVGNDAWATGNPVFKGSSLMFPNRACRFGFSADPWY